MAKTAGKAAFIFGIISLPFSAVVLITILFDVLPFVPIIGWIFPIIAIVVGILGLVIDDTKGWAIAGIIFGIIGLVLMFYLRPLVTSLFPSLLSCTIK